MWIPGTSHSRADPAVGLPRIRFRGITRRFPGIVALRDVSFDVAAGSCHAICGENGAGKSTLGRVLAGLAVADEGTIELDGQHVRFVSPRHALDAGVAMVHQELSFCENLTVGDNLCLGGLPHRRGLVDEQELRRRALDLLAATGATIDPSQPVHALGIADRQLVQIAAAVGQGARVIVFDEPTSSLGDPESQRLFGLIRGLCARGVTVLYVSHRMPEIFALCDTITVLRDGAHVATQPASQLDEATLVRLMIGRDVGSYYPQHASQPPGEERLCVERLSSPGRFADVSLRVCAGEVVGLAGLVGAGRSEVAQAIFGLDSACRGDVYVRGTKLRPGSPRDAMRAGLGLVPEDRKRQGLVLGMRAMENASLPVLPRFARAGWVDLEAEAVAVDASFARVGVRHGGREAVVGSLSGGNQQKVVMARWLTAGSDIILLDEPTRGVDVGAKAELHRWIDERASEGAAFLLVSSELPELLALSTRIVVLREGRVHAEVARRDATQDGLLRLMAGLD
ncbi:MAG: sugar ABC transporter ATP-binding protein [Gemmatimonadetes bacterium]|nr:sugar ABC transporter ATP-binding protein [Gemmatimonadota bacterium]